MSSFKFGVNEIASKDIYKQSQLTDILTINGKKFLLSYRVSCNNGKDWWYIVDYEEDGETIIPIKESFTTTYLNTTRTQPIQYHSMSLKRRRGFFNIKKSGM